MSPDPPAVVLIEDDPNIADLVDLYLRNDGYRVYQATNGEAGLDLVRDRSPKLVILDVGLPGELDGLGGVPRSCGLAGDIPIIMLTARDGEIDRVLGLEMGADDYVTKPFSPRELVARVKAILRRADGPPRDAPTVLRAGAGRGRPGPPRGPAGRRGRWPWPPASSTCWPTWPRTRAWPSAAASCSTACGGSTGSATSARSTSTCASSARSWATASRSSTVWGVGYRLD